MKPQLFIVLLCLAGISHAKEEEQKGRWCQEFTIDCPEKNRAYYRPIGATNAIWDVSKVAFSEQYLCMGPHTVTCTKVEETSEDSCFSGDMTVKRVRDHQLISMKDLRIGDVIYDADSKPTKVLGWLHREPDKEFEIMKVDGLKVSPDHLLRDRDGTYKFASEFPGAIPGTARGAYAPFTRSGTLSVEGHPVSCYAQFYNHHISHIFVSMAYEMGQVPTMDIVVPPSDLMLKVRDWAKYLGPSLFQTK